MIDTVFVFKWVGHVVLLWHGLGVFVLDRAHSSARRRYLATGGGSTSSGCDRSRAGR
jgi:hypothetical protein